MEVSKVRPIFEVATMPLVPLKWDPKGKNRVTWVHYSNGSWNVVHMTRTNQEMTLHVNDVLHACQNPASSVYNTPIARALQGTDTSLWKINIVDENNNHSTFSLQQILGGANWFLAHH